MNCAECATPHLFLDLVPVFASIWRWFNIFQWFLLILARVFSSFRLFLLEPSQVIGKTKIYVRDYVFISLRWWSDLIACGCRALMMQIVRPLWRLSGQSTIPRPILIEYWFNSSHLLSWLRCLQCWVILHIAAMVGITVVVIDDFFILDQWLLGCHFLQRVHIISADSAHWRLLSDCRLLLFNF